MLKLSNYESANMRAWTNQIVSQNQIKSTKKENNSSCLWHILIPSVRTFFVSLSGLISGNLDRVIDAMRRVRDELPSKSGLITSTGRYLKK